MQSVSTQDKEKCALSALNRLVMRLIKDFGNNSELWLEQIYSTYFILNLFNTNTGYWGEGVVYHEYELIKELDSDKINYTTDNKIGSINKAQEKDVCWVITHIIYGMQKICHLSTYDICKINQNTPLMHYLVQNYEAFKDEGMWANLHQIQQFLSYYSIKINIDESIIGKKGIPS